MDCSQVQPPSSENGLPNSSQVQPPSSENGLPNSSQVQSPSSENGLPNDYLGLKMPPRRNPAGRPKLRPVGLPYNKRKHVSDKKVPAAKKRKKIDNQIVFNENLSTKTVSR
ncbi:uncharacterized protein [Clytia hemisphaerica]|uniref:uncharacterized protein n=1 Tax=Clytia hemisphaerica TaxID=252671 RepID=UPI0034D74B30